MPKRFCVPWGLAVLFWQSTPKAQVLSSFQKILIYCQNLFIDWRNVSVIMAAAQGPKFFSWLNSSTRIVYSCYPLMQGYGQLKKWHRCIACIYPINWWKSLWRIRADFSSTLHCVAQYGMARKVSKANSSIFCVEKFELCSDNVAAPCCMRYFTALPAHREKTSLLFVRFFQIIATLLLLLLLIGSPQNSWQFYNCFCFRNFCWLGESNTFGD